MCNVTIEYRSLYQWYFIIFQTTTLTSLLRKCLLRTPKKHLSAYLITRKSTYRSERKSFFVIMLCRPPAQLFQTVKPSTQLSNRCLHCKYCYWTCVRHSNKRHVYIVNTAMERVHSPASWREWCCRPDRLSLAGVQQ